MATKENFTFARAPELESQQQIKGTVIPRTHNIVVRKRGDML